ncbi:MAG TPA: hypothetical protein VHW90_13700 [Stellaceae bacterium]|jgi:hypothetical protein|nr:hypothetical protein [Stellaceae bacterium]
MTIFRSDELPVFRGLAQEKCRTCIRLVWNDWNLIVFGFVMGGVLVGVIETVAAADSALFLGKDGRLQWETLLTGLAAVAAAVATIINLRLQIAQTDRLAGEATRRRADAARAMLPLALSELAEYASACIRQLSALRPNFRAEGALDQGARQGYVSKDLALPQLSENVLALLKECVEFMDEVPAGGVVELIRHLQIQRARLAQGISKLKNNDTARPILRGLVDQAIRDAAEVGARAMSLFPYSRGEPLESIEVNRQQVHDVLMFSGCFSDLHEIDLLADTWQEEKAFSKEIDRRRQQRSETDSE